MVTLSSYYPFYCVNSYLPNPQGQGPGMELFLQSLQRGSADRGLCFVDPSTDFFWTEDFFFSATSLQGKGVDKPQIMKSFENEGQNIIFKCHE